MSVCEFVCPQTTPREINEYRQIIHHWKRNFPGTKVIYFRSEYDYLVRKYTKKNNFGPPEFLIFFRCTKCRNFFYNPLFIKTVNYFLKKSRDFFEGEF